MREALDKWIATVNISFEDVDDEVHKGICHGNSREVYTFSFSVDEPEIYVGKVVIEGENLIGESSTVSG